MRRSLAVGERFVVDSSKLCKIANSDRCADGLRQDKGGNAMSSNKSIQVGPLKEIELQEAGRIVRLAFGTFLGLPNPLDFMGDRNFMTPRWRSPHVKAAA
jgi:hypothetical protein